MIWRGFWKRNITLDAFVKAETCVSSIFTRLISTSRLLRFSNISIQFGVYFPILEKVNLAASNTPWLADFINYAGQMRLRCIYLAFGWFDPKASAFACFSVAAKWLCRNTQTQRALTAVQNEYFPLHVISFSSLRFFICSLRVPFIR